MASLKKIISSAERLAELRKLIEDREVETRAYKLERDMLQDALIVDMTKTGLSSLKVKSGETYTKAVRRGIEITDDIQAFKWAVHNKAIAIDKTIAGQIIKEMTDVPQGFKRIESEYIRVTKPKEE